MPHGRLNTHLQISRFDTRENAQAAQLLRSTWEDNSNGFYALTGLLSSQSGHLTVL